MKRLPLSFLALPVAVALASSCASKLPRDLTDNTPGGMQLEEALDTSLINFRVAATGDVVNLREYMERENRNFLLLTFGSKGCAACNRKAQHLTKDVIGFHPLYLTEQGKHFEIVGINTDMEPYQKLASYLTGYPFIKWSDPAGKVMLDYFMPPGNKFSVPLSVMIGRDGIAWRVLPHDTISLTDILAKVEKTLGIRDDLPPTDGGEGEGEDGGSDGVDGGGEGGGDDGPEIPEIALASVGPGRLKSVKATSCANGGVTLDSALGAGDVRFVQVVSGNCGGTCQANIAELNATAAACDAERTAGRSCAVASLQTGATLQTECATGIAFQGGAEFYQVFKSFFDWTYTPLENPQTLQLTLPPVEGPLVLGFNTKGEIVFAKEGALAAGELKDVMTSAGDGALARGPDFKIYDNVKGEFGFADLRRKTKLTVVAADRLSTSFPCGPCEVELAKWSEQNDFLDWCKQNANQCQLIVLENRALPSGMTLPGFYDLVLNGGMDPDDGATPVASLKDRGNLLPLIIDPKPEADYLHRFYDGYMMAASPDLPGGGRVFVYNQEGLLLAKYLTGDSAGGEDHVFGFVKEYLK